MFAWPPSTSTALPLYVSTDVWQAAHVSPAVGSPPVKAAGLMAKPIGQPYGFASDLRASGMNPSARMCCGAMNGCPSGVCSAASQLAGMMTVPCGM